MKTEAAKHTPGPWLIGGARYVYAAGQDGANICAVGEPRASTTVGYTPLELGSKDNEEAYANARLIAAAPDMLALLKDLHSHGYTTSQDHDRVAAMIAKAEGRVA